MLTIPLSGACRTPHNLRRHDAMLGIGGCRHDRGSRGVPPPTLVASDPGKRGFDPAHIRCGWLGFRSLAPMGLAKSHV